MLTVLLYGYVLALATVVKPLRKVQLESYLLNTHLLLGLVFQWTIGQY